MATLRCRPECYRSSPGLSTVGLRWVPPSGPLEPHPPLESAIASAQRAIFALVAVVAGLTAAAIAVQDVRFEDRTCGSALVSTDPSKVVVLTGDPAIDDFEAGRLSGSCNRRILRTRFLVAVPLTVAGVAIYFYLRPDPDRSLRG